MFTGGCFVIFSLFLWPGWGEGFRGPEDIFYAGYFFFVVGGRWEWRKVSPGCMRISFMQRRPSSSFRKYSSCNFAKLVNSLLCRCALVAGSLYAVPT